MSNALAAGTLIADRLTGPAQHRDVLSREETDRVCLPTVSAEGWRLVRSCNGYETLARPVGGATWAAAWGTHVVRVDRREIATVVRDGVIWGDVGDPIAGRRWVARAENLV